MIGLKGAVFNMQEKMRKPSLLPPHVSTPLRCAVYSKPIREEIPVLKTKMAYIKSYQRDNLTTHRNYSLLVAMAFLTNYSNYFT